MFIPWEQFQSKDVLEVQGSDTVAELRDRLLCLGGSAQHLSALVVHLSDGRVVPSVVAQLKELANKYGRRILEQRLDALAEELCPRPWQIEDPSVRYEEAERLAAQRRLPLVVAAEGEYVGLCRPASELESYRSPQGLSFDLFDRSEPEEGGMPFIWVTEDAPLALVAQRLRRHGEKAPVYVLMGQGEGQFRLASQSALDSAIAALVADTVTPAGLSPADPWTVPLSRLQTTFSDPCLVRDVAEVSGRQAKNLARTQPLVLVQSGIPVALYTEEIRGADVPATDSGSEGYLGAVPDHILDDILSATEPNTGPAMQPRFVNSWFEDGARVSDRAPVRLGQGTALDLGQLYYLALNVGRLLDWSIIDWDAVQGGPQAIMEPQAREGHLYVSLSSGDFEIPEPTQSLYLPKDGDSPTVRFRVIPLRTSRGKDLPTLEVLLYYRTHLVQTFKVQAPVAPGCGTVDGNQLQRAELVHARTAGFPEMERLPPRELSLTIAKDGPDRYQLTFLVDPEIGSLTATGAAASPARAMELCCHVQVTRDDLTHLITKARRQLYNVVQAFDLLQVRDPVTCQRSIRALAQVGRQLCLKLFASSSASALSHWMNENLPDGSTIQIIDLAGDFVFPWSLVYTAPPWDDDEPVDVGRFWGWRYQLVVLNKPLLDTYRRVPAEMMAADPVRLSVGLYERLVGTDEQKAFFAELPGWTDQQVVPEIMTDRREMSDALAAADRDIYYFFCHGYTERIATDIQLDADLVSHFAQLAYRSNGSPTSEQLESPSMGYASQAVREHLDDLFDVSDSWLRLTRGKIPLTMLKEIVAGKFLRHPLVFLNMCESAQVLPSLSDGFVPFFIERGARAVVGTECSMNTLFADEFARAFLHRFFAGEPVGAILLALRRQYLQQGNPLALAYSLYSDADLRLNRPLLAEGRSADDLGRGYADLAVSPATGKALGTAVEDLWQDDLDGLMLTLASRVEAAQKGVARDELHMWAPSEAAFASDEEASPEWTARMIALGEQWWVKLEPRLYDVLCNEHNEHHDVLMDALVDGVKLLAIALAPALVAQAAALPAIAVVVATIAAKKVAESGLETACDLWVGSLGQQREGPPPS